jgi:hypothetical protein
MDGKPAGAVAFGVRRRGSVMARRWATLGLLAVAVAAQACGGGGTADGGRDVPADLAGDPGAEAGDDVPADVPADPAGDVAGDLPGPETAGDLPADRPADEGLPGAWAGSDPFPLDGAFFARHPEAFARMSGYGTHVQGPVADRPNVGHRGAFGAGNGLVFGFVGESDPLNTLHTLEGPTYERRPAFFGDWSVRLARATDATLPDFDEEWAARSLSAPVLVTRGRLGELELDTVDVAPVVGSAVVPSWCWVRALVVRNRGAAESAPLELVVKAYNPVESPAAGVLVERQAAADGKVRRVAVQFQGVDGAAATVRDGTLVLALAPVAAGAESDHVVTFCTDTVDEGAEAAPAGATLGDTDTAVGAVLQGVAAAYGAWEQPLLQADLPDPMVADFLDGLKMTLKVQTALQGATCPMSEYTRTWARDNVGPVMAMLAFGAFGDVEAMLDYVEAAIRYQGDLQNSYAADLDPTLAPPAPDWSTLGPLGARVAGETPSYMVRMYGLYQRYTGRTTRVDDRWGLLRRCLYAQGFGADDLLPFTGDETYRAAMNAAMGLGLEVPHQDLNWSANSTFLWLGAARDFARMAEVTGRAEEATEARARATSMAASAVPRYVLPDGCVAAFVDKATLAASAPFEDVALQVLWSGWKDGDDDFAAGSLQCLGDRLRRAPGEWVSRPAQDYEGMFGAWEGVYTGMLPGYLLASLAEAGHSEGEAAFQAVRKSLDTSGNLQEYMIFDDHSGLSVAYDPAGALGDYTAKFRPWEGGIVAEAVVRWLLGARPDATARTLELRPHLPAGWPRMAFRQVRAGGESFDVQVARDGADGPVTVTVTRGVGGALADWSVALRWDAPSGAPGFAAGGVAVPDGDVQRWATRFGTVSARAPAVSLSPGATVTWTVGPGGQP